MGIIYTDDVGRASSALFSGPSVEMQSYLNSSINQYIDNVKLTSPDFANLVLNKFNDYNSENTLRYLDNLRNKIDSVWLTDIIKFLPNVVDIQLAPDSMKEYLLAYPPIKERFINNNISAWGMVPNNTNVGINDYTYRRVTENVIHRDEQGSVKYVQYFENLNNKEDKLTLLNKSNILGSWDIIERSMESGNNVDVTDVFNGTM